MSDPPPKFIPIEVLPPESPPPTPPAPPNLARRFKIAQILAVLLDAIQIGFFPAFLPGFASPLDVGVDCLGFLLFWRLVGWHPALLPSFILKEIPMLDLAPTWTIAVWLAIRRNSKKFA
jgi:hypothetical protein